MIPQNVFFGQFRRDEHQNNILFQHPDLRISLLCWSARCLANDLLLQDPPMGFISSVLLTPHK